jgi:hypothetical protein
MSGAKRPRPSPARIMIPVEDDYCIACGCGNFSPCETDAGPCSWSIGPFDGKGLCSRCADYYVRPTATFAAVERILTQRRVPA